VLTAHLLQERASLAQTRLGAAAQAFVAPMKEFLALDPEARCAALEEFCGEMAGHIGALEACLTPGQAD